MNLFHLLGIAIALSAAITLFAHSHRAPRHGLIYIFKPLTTILILIFALLPGTFLTETYVGTIALGLIFSLAGDIFLMLPGDYFLHGLVSFLIAHLWYWGAFFPTQWGTDLLWPLIPLILLGLGVLRFLWSGLAKSLQVPVIIYIVALAGMTTLAIFRTLQFPSTATLSAAIGALFFLTSDTILAIDRFRKPFQLAKILVIATYYLGQYLIALSVPLS